MLVLQYCLSQVYVVVGGWDGYSTLSSTEMLSEGEDVWRERAPLPRPLSYLKSVSLGNVIYLTGRMIEFKSLVIMIHDETVNLQS